MDGDGYVQKNAQLQALCVKNLQKCISYVANDGFCRYERGNFVNCSAYIGLLRTLSKEFKGSS